MSPHDSTHADPALAVPGALRSRLQASSAETLSQIFIASIQHANPAEITLILAEHRPAFYGVINALGVGILDFLAENPSPAEIDAVRTQVVDANPNLVGYHPNIQSRLSFGDPRSARF